MIYVLDYKEQIRRIKEMVAVRKNMEAMEVFYHDPQTGELWKSFFPRYTKKDKGPKLLRPEPLPESLELQLEECLNSEDKNDPVGLGIELSAKPEGWAELLALLENNRKNYRRSNFFSFLKHSGLLNPVDALNEIEKKPESFGLTQKKLKSLRRGAKFLRFKRFFGI